MVTFSPKVRSKGFTSATRRDKDFLREEFSQLCQETQHNDNLRWLLLGGWIAGEIWAYSSLLSASENPSLIGPVLLIGNAILGPLVMAFHAIERRKIGELHQVNTIIRRRLAGIGKRKDENLRAFERAWKGTDGIYTYVIAVVATGVAFLQKAEVSQDDWAWLLGLWALLAWLLPLFCWSICLGKRERNDDGHECEKRWLFWLTILTYFLLVLLVWCAAATCMGPCERFFAGLAMFFLHLEVYSSISAGVLGHPGPLLKMYEDKLAALGEDV